jgi:cytochrome bd ubiquinol oxidase subunit II
LVELWFALLCFMLTMFVVLDGWDIGAGALHFLVAKNDPERRQVIAAIGPLWSWHEVWLVAAGGTFVLAFPELMAVSFSGFYLALWMVLWSFVLRGISIEVGGHINDSLWRSGWDFVFAASNVLLAILFGTALGNVIRGVPIDGSGMFSMSLFTDFTARGRVGILDWYTLSVAVFATVLLSAHGATYLRLKTVGPVHERSERLARLLWLITAALFVVVSVETSVVRPELFQALLQRPLAWMSVIVIGAAVWALSTGLRGQAEGRAFAGSCGVIAGLLAGAGAGLFPVVFHSTLSPEHSMTAYTGATAERGLRTALFWWPVAVALALMYFFVIMRIYAGKVRPSQGTQGY